MDTLENPSVYRHRKNGTVWHCYPYESEWSKTFGPEVMCILFGTEVRTIRPATFPATMVERGEWEELPNMGFFERQGVSQTECPVCGGAHSKIHCSEL